MLVEQAIYTSCQTSRASGYQLAAASPGIVEADLRELSLWGPSHDSLWEAGAAALSVNFHRLPSGAYCVSQTMPAGAEYSQRRGPQVYTQSLVVDPDGLAEFGNNPSTLLQASIALGHACVLEKIPKRLDPFCVAPEVQENSDSLAQLVRHPGPVWLGLLLDCALSAPSLGIVAGDRGACLVAALVQCLPRECRVEFSFTTGLRFSPRRPFRVICLPNHSAENQRLARLAQLTLFEMKGHPSESASLGGWASFVTAAIASGNTEYLAAELARPRNGLTLTGLDRLGDQLAQGLRALQSAPRGTSAVKERLVAAGTAVAQEGSDLWQRADGAHRPCGTLLRDVNHLAERGATLPADLDIEEEPARAIGQACPAALDNLQLLEDAIFEAMAGKTGVLDRLSPLWLTVLFQVGPAREEATREHYLRFALAVWRQLNQADVHQDPSRGAQAMQVICLLFGQ
jgi:hypothetical protein